MNKVTILTPTYNRKDKLFKLYNSLKKQSNKDFNWYVVDDGSVDNTDILIEKFRKENIVNISYIYQKNSGKHVALNTGISKIDTDMVFIVDSDDYLKIDAIETIYKYYYKYKNIKEICGFSFLRMYPNGKINDKLFPINESIETYIQSRINGEIKGDKAEVFFTKCLKEYPFPVFKNEKFLTEAVVWIKMAEKYKMVNINKPIYIGDYLDDGLTKNRRKTKIKSPLGNIEYGKALMNKKCNLKIKLKGMLIYITYSFFANKKIKDMYNEIEMKVFFILLFPAGKVIYQMWKSKYGE